jgi:hypothetical protein
VAAALFGHTLTFIDSERTRQPSTWCVCNACRISCYVDVRTAESTDKSIERWMLRPCGELSDPETFEVQMVLQVDGIKTVFSKDKLSKKMLGLIATGPSIGGTDARFAQRSDHLHRLHERLFARVGRVTR